ncbi:hypothetical protein [Nostoc sp.]|uniref:hypothetical protein n=1 Tax=Nostoc sp. TaxID=1180 RepID=UPI002FF6D625
MQPLNPKPGKIDIPPMDKTAQVLNSSSIRPNETSSGNQFVEALEMANQGIVKNFSQSKESLFMLYCLYYSDLWWVISKRIRHYDAITLDL